MFDNIGGKIKTLAKVVCWIGIVISVILGLLSGNAITALLFTGIGALCSWIGSFMTYGLGQLIENTDILVEQGYKKQTLSSDKEKSKSLYTPIENPPTTPKWTCPECKNVLPGDVIKCKCGYTKED